MDSGETMDFLMKNKAAMPRHIAIIMDGNGRWATERKLPRPAGHKAGAERVRPVLELSRKLGIPVMTLFAFSTENWQRPETEVSAIMGLLDRFIDRETPELIRNRVHLCFPGNIERIPEKLRKKMRHVTEITSRDYEFTLNICVSYGGRDEIVQAVKKILNTQGDTDMALAALDEKSFSDKLFTSGLPDPDILIRTGGDKRISNFLLWQLAYAEIFFYPKYWPDFGPEDLAECLREFVSRDRRFGKVKDNAVTATGLLSSVNSPSDLKKMPEEQLGALAEEIREAVISRVSVIGGHLASNLGVVELTIALHRVFDSPADKLIWDVGHQCYPHKLLTGRYENFDSLRTRDGVSGFPKRSESEHDCFDTGHGSTSISAALGMAAARDIKGEKHHVVCVCGDGAMTGGMAFEALNHAVEVSSNLIVILNDNSFSISPITGALGRSLSRIRTNATYVHFHQTLQDKKNRKSKFFAALSFATTPLRALGKYLAFRKGIVFEELGFQYVGPVDGHNIREITDYLEKIKKIKGPVLLHVLTQKGKGYEPAETDPSSYHGVSRLDDCEEKQKIDIRPADSFTATFGKSLEKLCEKDARIVGVTAAMPGGTGMQNLFDKFPGRFFDVGMAEQHAVTFAAGLASQGLRPVVAVYSTFLQRAYDQIFHDVCLQNLPVVFAVDRAGLVSRYGQTHQGILDISFLRNLPNIVLLAPRDTVELELMLEYSFTLNQPAAIRYPADSDAGVVKTGARPPIEHATAEILCEGRDAAFWAVGPAACEALKAAKILQQNNISARVINARFVSPMDEKTLQKCVDDGITRFFTIEDHILPGGFGSLFLETAGALKIDLARVTRIGVAGSFIPEDSRASLLKDHGLTAETIAAEVMRETVKGKSAGAGSC